MKGVSPKDPAWKAVRAVVRGNLDEAASAAARLSAAGDPEALHDVRVAVRHLRVVMKAYAPDLKPGVPKGLRDAFSALASMTTDARDAEVFVAWLRKRVGRLAVARRPAAQWLIQLAEIRLQAAYRSLRRLVPKAVAMIEPVLRAGLAIPPRAGRNPAAESFESRSARIIAKQAEELVAAIDKVRGPTDDDPAHEARIAAKKVRYLLEPAVGPRGTSVIKPMKDLQSRLGDLHDLAGVAAQVAHARRGRSKDPALAPTAARIAAIPFITALAAREHDALFRRIREEFLSPPRAWLRPLRAWIRRHEASVRAESGRLKPAVRLLRQVHSPG